MSLYDIDEDDGPPPPRNNNPITAPVTLPSATKKVVQPQQHPQDSQQPSHQPSQQAGAGDTGAGLSGGGVVVGGTQHVNKLFDDFFGGGSGSSSSPQPQNRSGNATAAVPAAAHARHNNNNATTSANGANANTMRASSTSAISGGATSPHSHLDDLFSGGGGGKGSSAWAAGTSSTGPTTGVNGGVSRSQQPARAQPDDDFLDFNSGGGVGSGQQRHGTSAEMILTNMERARKGLQSLQSEAMGNLARQQSALGGGAAGSMSTATILGNPLLLARMTHYEVLGLDMRTADAEAISRAYKKKALELHPDRRRGRGEAQTPQEQAYFKAVVRANEVLSDEEQRRAYDEALEAHWAGGGTGAPPLVGASSPAPQQGGDNSPFAPSPHASQQQQQTPFFHTPAAPYTAASNNRAAGGGSSSNGGTASSGGGDLFFGGQQKTSVDDLFS